MRSRVCTAGCPAIISTGVAALCATAHPVKARPAAHDRDTGLARCTRPAVRHVDSCRFLARTDNGYAFRQQRIQQAVRLVSAKRENGANVQRLEGLCHVLRCCNQVFLLPMRLFCIGRRILKFDATFNTVWRINLRNMTSVTRRERSIAGIPVASTPRASANERPAAQRACGINPREILLNCPLMNNLFSASRSCTAACCTAALPLQILCSTILNMILNI